MRKIRFEVVQYFEVLVDDENDVVQDYEDDKEMLLDCIMRNFSEILPVVQTKGVQLKDSDIIGLDVLD